MKFSHIADCHLGSWRDPAMREAGLQSFAYAIQKSLDEKVDFIIIAGDLFNTAIPSIEILRSTVQILAKVKDANIPVYLIAGSHDYSPSGKSMLGILEDTGLIVNVLQGEVVDSQLQLKFTVDPKTQTKICGILGRAQSLEKQYYQMLNKESLEAESGFKIFVFHTALEELKPKDIGEATALSYLPKGFDYYAGGHVHYRYNEVVEPYGRIVYPGPTFPNSFSELEELRGGSFVINTVDANGTIHSEFEHIKLHPYVSIQEDISTDWMQKIPEDLTNTIVTVRLTGSVERMPDVSEQFQTLSHKAYAVLKNTAGVVEKQFEAFHIDVQDVPNIEEKILAENLGQFSLGNQKEIAKELLHALNTTKQESETSKDFEDRIILTAKRVFGNEY